MANQTKSVLKGYFETGDSPSQAQYADLIDSKLNLAETGVQIAAGTISSSILDASVSLKSINITASNNISASGTITANTLTSNNIVFTPGATSIKIEAPDESSGNADGANLTIEPGDAFGSNQGGGNLTLNAGKGSGAGSGGDITLNTFGLIGGGSTANSGSFIVNGKNFSVTSGGNINATGNISASNASTASFGSAMLTNLPTSKPTITGSLWLSGSADDGTSKYLLVFTG